MFVSSVFSQGDLVSMVLTMLQVAGFNAHDAIEMASVDTTKYATVGVALGPRIMCAAELFDPVCTTTAMSP